MPVILNCFAIAPYAAILGIFYFFLSGRVANMRRVDRLPTGHAKHARLERGVRAHGNFAEYTPFALLLILLAVLTGASALMAQYTLRHVACRASRACLRPAGCRAQAPKLPAARPWHDPDAEQHFDRVDSAAVAMDRLVV